MGDDLRLHELENLRRSIAMLRPRHPSALDWERALRLLERLQHLERIERREQVFSCIRQIRALIDTVDTA